MKKTNNKNKKPLDPKVIFRKSKQWKDFRIKLKKKQKVDPITGSPLSKGCNCHHRDFDPNKYTDITVENHFVCLNNMSHEVLHFVYGSSQNRKNWKKILENLRIQCELMDEINGGK